MLAGAPGSGKTKTVIALISILAIMKQKVLVVAPNNGSTDRFLMRLKDSGFTQFIRVTNNVANVSQSIQANARSNESFSRMNEIKSTLEGNYIYASTCDRINENLLLCVGGFDLCIVLDAD